MTSANLFRRLAAGEVSEAEVAVALDVSPTGDVEHARERAHLG